MYVEAGRSLHDAHNSLEWVWQTLLEGKDELLKFLHLALACCRAAVPRAIEHLYAWLRHHVMPSAVV